MALAIWSGIAPSVWEHEDPRVLETALEMMESSLERGEDGR